MTSPLAAEQERLKQKARQELRTARQARADVIHSFFANQTDKAKAHAAFYAAINKAARDGVLTPTEIQETAILSRQRYHQIVRTPAPPKPTEVQLPEADLG